VVCLAGNLAAVCGKRMYVSLPRLSMSQTRRPFPCRRQTGDDETRRFLSGGESRKPFESRGSGIGKEKPEGNRKNVGKEEGPRPAAVQSEKRTGSKSTLHTTHRIQISRNPPSAPNEITCRLQPFAVIHSRAIPFCDNWAGHSLA
jgi:hypothetical protein